MCNKVPWLSWLKRLHSKQEITSSNLVGTSFYSCPEVDWVIMTISQFLGVYLLLLLLLLFVILAPFAMGWFVLIWYSLLSTCLVNN